MKTLEVRVKPDYAELSDPCCSSKYIKVRLSAEFLNDGWDTYVFQLLRRLSSHPCYGRFKATYNESFRLTIIREEWSGVVGSLK